MKPPCGPRAMSAMPGAAVFFSHVENRPPG